MTPYAYVPGVPAVVHRRRTEAGPPGAAMHEDTWYRFDEMGSEREFEDYDDEEDPEKKDDEDEEDEDETSDKMEEEEEQLM